MRFILLFTFSIYSFLVAAQDYVTVTNGPGYGEQYYYSFTTQKGTKLKNTDWDLAFSSIGQTDGGIFINESSTSAVPPIKLFLSEVQDWATPITDTKAYVDSVSLHNPLSNWSTGAFNSIKTPNQLDYGWGTYNPTQFKVVGNKVFVLAFRNGTFKKFQITELGVSGYKFKISDLDGANEKAYTVAKEIGKPLLYFSLEKGSTIDVPSYDLIFQRYITYLDDNTGTGNKLAYNVTGVLLAPNVKAVEIDGVEPADVDPSKYDTEYKAQLDLIGHDWKAFSMSAGWSIDADRTFLIETQQGQRYKINFIDFEGSSTGNITFAQSTLTTSVSEENNHISVKVYPNPAQNHITITTGSQMQGSIYTLSGNKIQTVSSNTSQDISSLSPGCYLIVIGNASIPFIKTK